MYTSFILYFTYLNFKMILDNTPFVPPTTPLSPTILYYLFLCHDISKFYSCLELLIVCANTNQILSGLWFYLTIFYSQNQKCRICLPKLQQTKVVILI
jgi:hypothetical protein